MYWCRDEVSCSSREKFFFFKLIAVGVDYYLYVIAFDNENKNRVDFFLYLIVGHSHFCYKLTKCLTSSPENAKATHFS